MCEMAEAGLARGTSFELEPPTRVPLLLAVDKTLNEPCSRVEVFMLRQ